MADKRLDNSAGLPALRDEIGALRKAVEPQVLADLVAHAVGRALKDQQSSANLDASSPLPVKIQINAAPRLLRSVGTAARFPAGSGLVGAIFLDLLHSSLATWRT